MRTYSVSRPYLGSYSYSHQPQRRNYYSGSYRNHYQVSIPSSTKEKIVFPYDKRSLKFNTSAYTPAATDNRASLEEIQAFLQALEPHVKLNQIESSNLALRISLTSLCVLTIGSVVIVFFYLIVALGDVMILPIMIGVFAICFLILGLFRILVKRRNMRLKRRCIEFTNKHINDQGNLFTERGLKWVVPSSYPHWIELSIVHKKPEIGTAQEATGSNNEPKEPIQSGSGGQIVVEVDHQPQQQLHPIQEEQVPLEPEAIALEYALENYRVEAANQGHELIEKKNVKDIEALHF